MHTLSLGRDDSSPCACRLSTSSRVFDPSSSLPIGHPDHDQPPHLSRATSPTQGSVRMPALSPLPVRPATSTIDDFHRSLPGRSVARDDVRLPPVSLPLPPGKSWGSLIQPRQVHPSHCLTPSSRQLHRSIAFRRLGRGSSTRRKLSEKSSIKAGAADLAEVRRRSRRRSNRSLTGERLPSFDTRLPRHLARPAVEAQVSPPAYATSLRNTPAGPPRRVRPLSRFVARTRPPGNRLLLRFDVRLVLQRST